MFTIHSGISGSGKSVGASRLLSQLYRLATHTKKEARLANNLQQAQQVLDAFGCCYTRRNTNTSMFSKFLEIQLKLPSQVEAVMRNRMTNTSMLCLMHRRLASIVQ